MQGAFYGIGAAVIAIIARSAVKLTRLTLGSDPLLWAIFARGGCVTAWTESEIVWVFLGAGVRQPGRACARRLPLRARVRWPSALLAAWPLHRARRSPAAGATLVARSRWYFAEAGAFVFGSGLAIVPFLHGGVVQQFGWLDERQFLDAVAVAMITPGPVVITVALHRLPGGRARRARWSRPWRRSCPATCSRSSRRRTSAASPRTRAQGVRRRRHRRRHRRHRGRGLRARTARDRGRGDPRDGGRHAARARALAARARAAAHRGRRACSGSWRSERRIEVATLSSQNQSKPLT